MGDPGREMAGRGAGEPQVAPGEAADPRPTVDGVPVRELNLLVNPAAFLVSSDGGTHEITRAYFQNGKYSIGIMTHRLGPHALEGITIGERGASLKFSTGYVVFIPQHRLQSTHKV